MLKRALISIIILVLVSTVTAIPMVNPINPPGTGGGNVTNNFYGTMNQTPNMTPGAPGADGMMNQTPNMTALNADMSWNASYYLRDNSRTLTAEKMRRDVDNDLFSLYGGNAIAGGTGGILSLFGKDTVNPFAIEMGVGNGGVGNVRVTGWVGGANPRMDMNGYNITQIKTIVAPTDAVNKSHLDDVNASMKAYVDTLPSGGSFLYTADQHIATNVTDVRTLMVTNQSAVWNNKTWDTVANQSAYVLAVNTSMRNNVSANFIPMVNQLAPTVNLGGAGADNTKYLRGDQTWQAVVASAPTSATAVTMSSDFYEPTINAVPGLLGVAIGSGTNVVFATTAPHPGVVAISDSTTAGGGYRYGCTATGNMLIAGGETFEFIFQTNGIRNTQDIRVGWADTATGTALPVDGVWLNLTNVAGAANWTGATASNSVYRTTASKFAGSAGTWYRGTIAINAAGTLVTYTIYNEAGVSQWTDTLSTSIPTGAGRDTSPCIIATESTTVDSAVLLRPDYASWSITRALVR